MHTLGHVGNLLWHPRSAFVRTAQRHSKSSLFMATPLPEYLQSSRDTALSGSEKQIVAVLGNSSCDLDSFVSAHVLSYFYNRCHDTKRQKSRPTYVPLLNLPSTPSSELWRLRPEFGAVLRLAINPGIEPSSSKEQNDISKGLLAPLVTIKDLSETKLSSPLSCLKPGAESSASLPCILVDHNAPSISGFSSDDLSKRLKLVGCIDHHVDESVIPSSVQPRIVKTGIGSCTSLIVKHLRDEGLWPAASSNGQTPLLEIAKVALAPILIDTFNLRATGDKCSDTDRESVSFLESHINSAPQATTEGTPKTEQWNREAFFETIHAAKQSALDLLTMPEILEHDYKEWTETSSTSGREATIGIPSLVRSLSWLIHKSGSASRFVDDILSFAKSRDLAVVALLTKLTDPDGKFRKEIALIVAPQENKQDEDDDEMLVRAMDDFERNTSSALKLQEWHEDADLLQELSQKVEGKGGSYRVWWQGDTEKSRKQVAPALRDAVKNAT